MPGIEPGAFHMQSEPLRYIPLINDIWRESNKSKMLRYV